MIRSRLSIAVLTLSLLVLLGPAPAAAASPDVVISEVYGGGGNSGATLTNDFIELYNGSTSAVSLAGWSVQYASSAGTSWAITPLSGSIAAGGHYLVQESAGTSGSTPLPTPDATGTIAMSATSGKVALVTSGGALACGGNCDTAANVRDFVGYGTANDFEASAAPALSNTTAASRNATRTDSDNNSTDFTAIAPAPQNAGFTPPPPPDPTGCDAPATRQVAEVQGAGDSTPLAGQSVRVEGIVTGDFQATGQLGGFFIQDDTPDGDPLTSDGLFVFSGSAVSPGDRVLISGKAIEFNGLTEISPVTAVDICGTGTIASTGYDLPRPAGTTFEPSEGVLLTFPEALSATEHFQLGRFGEVTVSSDGRQFTPTNLVEPGAPAQAALALDLRRRLLIDDGSSVKNPPTVPFLNPEALRIGDTASGITGVLSFGFNLYRLQPTAPITFARANPRPASPAPVGGDVQVASFNTLNYFTTLASQNPNARGANNAVEFGRQQAKEVAAITGLDADVLGLMEIENNGTTAVSSLVDALNAATAPGTYGYIVDPAINAPNEFGGTFGTDAIKVALIYKPAVVTPVGAAQTSADPIFNRPPLIQTFRRVAGGESFTVVVNHFKSKSCGGASGANLDQGDGQSCFNAARVAQSTKLAQVLDDLNVTNALLIGDLNSYTQEDPIDVLEAAGFTGLSERFIAEPGRYSYVFDGFSGELDHGLASADLLDNVTGATIWHINADEPLILDYNTEFNPAGLYQPDAFRSSDHDPLLIGLDLAAAPEAPVASAVAGWDAATVNWQAPGDGGSAITGYTVKALKGTQVVGSVTVGPAIRTHSFGNLTSGTTYTFQVVAINAEGSGPAGTTVAKPFTPLRYTRLDAGVNCPSFTVRNGNAYPVNIDWVADQTVGEDVVPANSKVTLTAPIDRLTLLRVYAGSYRLQDVALGRC